ncbi:MAG: hypothetical protein HYZ26_06595 [Chloroflexi bacterium]|nr:hypothetical protein [Chloroflexota bacterium]
MRAASHQPNPQRLSVVLGTVLLGYALSRFVEIQEQTLPLQFLGVFVPLRLNANVIVAALSAGLTGVGADWLLRDHPARGGRSTIPHLALPALTAWILSIPLNNLELSPTWWLAFLGAGLLLAIVLTAEFHTLEDLGLRNPFASAVLIALAYAIFLILVITLQAVGLRLVFLIPSLGLAATLVALRTSNILEAGGWRWAEAQAAALVVVQIGAPLHYFAVPPVSYGVLLLGALYGYSTLSTRIHLGHPLRQAFLSSALGLFVALVLASALAL